MSVTTPSTTTRAIAHAGKSFPPFDDGALFWSAFDRDAADSSEARDREAELIDADAIDALEEEMA